MNKGLKQSKSHCLSLFLNDSHVVYVNLLVRIAGLKIYSAFLTL